MTEDSQSDDPLLQFWKYLLSGDRLFVKGLLD